MKILLIDNFDSFTFNLVDFFRQLGCEVAVFRNTADPQRLAERDFDLLVLSPGPSVPRNAGNLMAIIGRFYREKPILGVCLGHQALVEFFGGTLDNIAPVHGKAVPIRHDGRGIFSGLEAEVEVARYHSWAAGLVPPELEISARAADGTVMAVRHKRLPIEGIQFHPESVLSMKNAVGMRMLQNVVAGRMSSGNLVFHRFSSVLQNGDPLETDLLRRFLQAAEQGQLSDDQKQILLTGLSFRLRNPDELTRFVAALMAFSQGQHLAAAFSGAVDICGTGGSGLPRINTSTLAALLLAHEGLPIAKHGNRAAAGRFGSFDLLEKLGLPLQNDPEIALRNLREANLAFLFAPNFHPVFKHFAPIRAQIGVPTVFNALGPLVNPAQPERQFIGTAFEKLMDVIFETAIRMGKKHVVVVRGSDGLDEISLSAPTRVLEFSGGQRREYSIEPADFGLESLPFSAFSAANGAECLVIARAMLDGRPETEHWKLVAANAAFIFQKFVEPQTSLPAAFERMEKLIFSGAMGAVFERVAGTANLKNTATARP